jgi:hypoxanthine phosphoribosyltransferase
MHRIAKQIEGIDFDWYVAISRGGLIPAALLSQITGQRNIDTICVSRYDENKKEKEIDCMDCKNFKHLRNQNVLIIDDLLDHGRTMDYVINIIKMYGPKRLNTAVLYWKERSIIEPDFYISMCENNMWINFNWEKDQDFVLPKANVEYISN